MNIQERSVKIKQKLDERRSLTRTRFKDLFYYLDNAIAFQFTLGEVLPEELKNKGMIPITDDKSLILLLFIRNNHYFLSCIQEAETSMVDPCYNIMRTIYEDMLMMYYVLGYPTETRLILDYYRDKLSGLNLQIVKKQKKWFKHKFLINNLYSPQRQVEAKLFYKEICRRAHHEITGMMANINYSDYSVEQCLQAMLYLCFQNIAVLVEAFYDDLSDSLKASAKDTLLEILAGLGGDYFPAFEPDNPTYSVSLRIKNWKINI